MTMKEKLLCLLAALLVLPAVCFGDKASKVINSGEHLRKKLQASFPQFPLLTLSTNDGGYPVFQRLDLYDNVRIDGVEFYGFRFKAPKRPAQEDLVWAFIEPVNLAGWYIVPQTGSMDGFENYRYERRIVYQGLSHLFPLQANTLIMQQLSGNSLEDDKEYLIWFAFKSKKPERMSVAFTFADLRSKKANNRAVMEQVLGLQHK